jgi:hypothetical protein
MTSANSACSSDQILSQQKISKFSSSLHFKPVLNALGESILFYVIFLQNLTFWQLKITLMALVTDRWMITSLFKKGKCRVALVGLRGCAS